ncbi:MAG: hypothetical protein CMJ64_27535 [Planctomycetaceae bacterium]|nr:hypothetical protein [Planctomycetaceae bacterium]
MGKAESTVDSNKSIDLWQQVTVLQADPAELRMRRSSGNRTRLELPCKCDAFVRDAPSVCRIIICSASIRASSSNGIECRAE